MKKQYKPIASLCLSNWGGIVILTANDDYITSGFDFGDGIKSVYTTRLYTGVDGGYYFRRYGRTYHIDDFVRL